MIGVALALIGCIREPAHDNPLDPDSPGFRRTGRLEVVILTRARQALADAEVTINRLGLFTSTGADGRAVFAEVPDGEWWVAAAKATPEVVYRADSVLVRVTARGVVDTVVALDALPRFESTALFSVTTASANPDTVTFRLRLRAVVEDPDGQADLSSVWWRYGDAGGGTLQYLPDSAFWQSEVSSHLLPVRGMDDLIGSPFYFEASDRVGAVARSAAAYLWKVIHETPIINPRPFQNPYEPTWTFYARDYNNQRDSTLYNFLLRFYDLRRIPPELVYQKWLAPTRFNTQSDTLSIELDTGFGRYLWEVFVVDRYGNLSRSPQVVLEP